MAAPSSALASALWLSVPFAAFATKACCFANGKHGSTVAAGSNACATLCDWGQSVVLRRVAALCSSVSWSNESTD